MPRYIMSQYLAVLVTQNNSAYPVLSLKVISQKESNENVLDYSLKRPQILF